jgi:hypothetical protein
MRSGYSEQNNERELESNKHQTGKKAHVDIATEEQSSRSNG